MLSAAFNLQETIDRLEQAQAPHALAVVVAQLLQENVASAAKRQTFQVEGIAPSTEFGVPTVTQYPSDALGKIEQKIDNGFVQVNNRIDKLHADMDRRFEASKADTDRRFEVFKVDTDRRFELMTKEFALVREEIKNSHQALMLKLGTLVVGTFVTVSGVLFAALRYLPAAS